MLELDHTPPPEHAAGREIAKDVANLIVICGAEPFQTAIVRWNEDFHKKWQQNDEFEKDCDISFPMPPEDKEVPETSVDIHLVRCAAIHDFHQSYARRISRHHPPHFRETVTRSMLINQEHIPLLEQSLEIAYRELLPRGLLNQLSKYADKYPQYNETITHTTGGIRDKTLVVAVKSASPYFSPHFSFTLTDNRLKAGMQGTFHDTERPQRSATGTIVVRNERLAVLTPAGEYIPVSRFNVFEPAE
jgi:hypothetical protein